MSSGAWAVSGILVGAILAGAAQVLLLMLQDRRARSVWLRDERLRVYGEFISVARRRVGGSEDGMMDAWTQVLIFGSPEAARCAADWIIAKEDHELGAKNDEFEDAQASDPFAVVIEIARARKAMINQVRIEAGVERLHYAGTRYL